MYFLGLGLVLLFLKYLALWPAVNWDWWQVMIPFVLAVVWWAWADGSGYTKRKAVEREEARKQARINKTKAALGQSTGKPRG